MTRARNDSQATPGHTLCLLQRWRASWQRWQWAVEPTSRGWMEYRRQSLTKRQPSSQRRGRAFAIAMVKLFTDEDCFEEY